MERFAVYRVDLDQAASGWFIDRPQRNGTVIDQRLFTTCKRYNDAGELTIEVIHPGKQLDFVLGTFGLPIVSEAVATTLESPTRNDAQLIPIRIVGVKEQFYIFNVIRCIECIDEDRSEFDLWTDADGMPRLVGNYRCMYKLWLDASKVGGAGAFRVSKWKVDLCVSNEVRRALIRIGHKGVTFTGVG